MKVALALVLLFAVACSNAAPATTPATEPTLSVDTTSPSAPSTSTTGVPNPLAGGVDSLGLASAVFDASGAARFRATSEVAVSRDRDGTDTVSVSFIESAYQRTPAAIELSIRSTAADRPERLIDVIAIDDEYWARQNGGEWSKDPTAAQLLSLASVSLLSPASLDAVLPLLQDVGEEEVAGRAAMRLSGDDEALAVFLRSAEIEDLNNFSELEYGTIDLWFDRAGFVSRAEYAFGGVRALDRRTEHYRARFELSDFDGAFEINRPE